MSIAPQSRALNGERQVQSAAEYEVRLQAAFDRLREIYRGRQKQALRGVSAEYVSSLLRRGTPCSLFRFVELLGPLSMAERAFVLGALVEDARPSDKPPLLEIAEATEIAGDALGCAQRLLAADSTSPQELAEAEQRLQAAQRELEDVKHAIRGTK